MDDVLIAGAGPTGLVLALWLVNQGISVRIVDRSDGPGETSRAMAVHARTLELYDQLGLADELLAAGQKNPVVNLWARGKRKARVPLGGSAEDLTPYPYILIYPQDEHERLLISRLRRLGVEVERRTEVLSFEQNEEYVIAKLRAADGTQSFAKARYLAGCDGARSLVRRLLKSDFAGGTYKQIFYVADVELEGLDSPEQAHLVLDAADLVAILPYGRGKHRLIGMVSDENGHIVENLTFEDVQHRAIDGLGISNIAVNWFSAYRVHHRVADRFLAGRVFLAGDSAHVHSPVGGQGMNTGIGDAINIAWKLAAVLKGNASDGLLPTFELERKAFATTLVDTTDRIFAFATAKGASADFVRTRVAPSVAAFAVKSSSVRRSMFRKISQIGTRYSDSPLSQGTAGRFAGGDRLPWVRTKSADNYMPLREIRWQIHIYGKASRDLHEWCKLHRVPLCEFEWTPEYDQAGLARDGLYLLRPDTWIALADGEQSVERLNAYVVKSGLKLGD